MYSLFRRFFLLLIAAVFPLIVLPAHSVEDAAPSRSISAESSPIVVWGRTIAYYRVAMEFPDATQRAKAASERISNALGDINAEDLRLEPLKFGETSGVGIYAGTTFLLKIMEGDIHPESGRTLDQTSAEILGALRLLINDHATQHSFDRLIPALVQSVVATLLFCGFWVFIIWLKNRLLNRIELAEKNTRSTLVFFGYDCRPHLLGLAKHAVRIGIVTILLLVVAYLWLTFILSRFPYTRHWGESLGSYLLDIVVSLGRGAVHQVPNLIAVIVIFYVTRALSKVLNSWFHGIETGKYLSTWMDVEAARATRRLVGIGLWIFAVILAFPYLPGSGSEAFKGMSVFLGLMISLGGASFVGQIIGGLAAIYTRAVRSGDYIAIGSTEGVVKELGFLTTKIVTPAREEVTIPNSMLVGSAIRNFSRGNNRTTLITTTVTIGYDAPWRQVQAMLLQAATETEGILDAPEPMVLQKSLDDFYVRYELVVAVGDPKTRAILAARLHGKIQDIFNANNVQIMSPHFLGQPSEPVVVPRNRWHVPPASPSA